MDAQHGTIASPRCGQVFLDKQKRIEGCCLDPVVPGEWYCAQHLIDAVARRDEKGRQR